MFRPVDDGPVTEAFDVVRTCRIVFLDGITSHERIGSKAIEDSEQLFSLTSRKGNENGQNSIVHRVLVTPNYLPSEDSLSCKRSSSSRECPPFWSSLSRRRPISARHSGSSCVVRQRTYSANSNRSSGRSASTACLISARLIRRQFTFCNGTDKAGIRPFRALFWLKRADNMKVVAGADRGDTIGAREPGRYAE